MSLSCSSPLALSRRKFLTLLGGISATLTGAGRTGATLAESTPEVILQKRGIGACGPCALSNSLLNGDAAGRKAFRRLPGAGATEQADALIRQYGSKPSETYGSGRGRFLSGAGLTCNDMPFLANDFLTTAGLPKGQGEWLDRRQGEEQLAHVTRLRGMFAGSIARGLPPIVEVRSFAADNNAAASAKQSWVNLYAHWLSLIGVETAAPGASGFVCRFADSFTGKVIAGYAHAELNRPFMATRGFTLKAKEMQDWQWLSGYPYVLVEVPDLPLLIQTRPWQSRTLVALTYMVHRPAA